MNKIIWLIVLVVLVVGGYMMFSGDSDTGDKSYDASDSSKVETEPDGTELNLGVAPVASGDLDSKSGSELAADFVSDETDDVVLDDLI